MVVVREGHYGIPQKASFEKDQEQQQSLSFTICRHARL